MKGAVVAFRLSDIRQLEELQEAAAARGESVSLFIRRAVWLRLERSRGMGKP